MSSNRNHCLLRLTGAIEDSMDTESPLVSTHQTCLTTPPYLTVADDVLCLDYN